MSGSAVQTSTETGVVTIIASATNIEDDVNDVVLPGAYAKTLEKRKPKIILGHDWKQAVAKVISAEEYEPHDPRLPTMLARSQFPVENWPKDAGALVMEVKFNLATSRGREAYEDVKFFGGDAEWSIGYKVRPGGSYRAKGVRYIKALDLYEVSLVLHGANRWSKTLDVKDVSTGSAPASTGRGFGMTGGLPLVAVRKRGNRWSLVRTETDTDLRFFDSEEEAHAAIARMGMSGKSAGHFTYEERGRLAEKGISLPDGSLPIITRDDVLTALVLAQALGGPDEIKHVRARAEALGVAAMVPAGVEGKRDYSTAQREAMADAGQALPDGSFPIKDEEDLRNALSLQHFAKDEAKARAHIRKRAAALGLMDVVDGWGKDEKHADHAQSTHGSGPNVWEDAEFALLVNDYLGREAKHYGAWSEDWEPGPHITPGSDKDTPANRAKLRAWVKKNPEKAKEGSQPAAPPPEKEFRDGKKPKPKPKADPKPKAESTSRIPKDKPSDDERMEALRERAKSVAVADDPEVAVNPADAESAGDEVMDFMRGLSDDEKAAVAHYTATGYRTTNRNLRRGKDPEPPPENGAMADTLDDMFERAPGIARDTKVVRGLTASGDFRAMLAGLKRGDSLVDDGFLSTSSDPRVVAGFSGNARGYDEMFDEGTVALDITMKKGTTALPVAAYSGDPTEREFLLPRGTSMRVTGVKEAKNGHLTISVEVG